MAGPKRGGYGSGGCQRVRIAAGVGGGGRGRALVFWHFLRLHWGLLGAWRTELGGGPARFQPAATTRRWKRGRGRPGFWSLAAGHAPVREASPRSSAVCTQWAPARLGGTGPRDAYHCPLGQRGPASRSWSFRRGGPGSPHFAFRAGVGHSRTALCRLGVAVVEAVNLWATLSPPLGDGSPSLGPHMHPRGHPHSDPPPAQVSSLLSAGRTQ